ncbi:unnamed protein product [Calypogeia fissa]
MFEEVILFCPHRAQEVAKGVVIFSFKTEAIDDELLGDDHVGVVVRKVLVSSYFPNIHPGVPGLVHWPVHCTMLAATQTFIGDILEKAVEESTSPGRYGIDPLDDNYFGFEKTPYNYIKRMKVDPDEERRRLLATKAKLKSSEASVDELMRCLCCKSKYCLMMPREDLADVRREFHGMYSNHKTDHILNLLRSREDEVKRKGLFVLKGRLICRDAFYEIHSFSQTKLYGYLLQAEEGCKVGFHGNQGLLKTRQNTMTARAFLEAILTENAEPMPHISYTGGFGTDTIEYRLPSCFSKKDIFKEVSIKMHLEGLKPVVESTLYDI